MYIIYVCVILLLCVCDDTAGRVVSVVNNTACRGSGRRSTSTPLGRSPRPARHATTKPRRTKIHRLCVSRGRCRQPAGRSRRQRWMTGPRSWSHRRSRYLRLLLPMHGHLPIVGFFLIILLFI